MKGLTKSLLSVAVIGSVVAANGQATFPLRVDIDVSARTSRENIGAGSGGDVKVENVQCKVKIRKSGGQPYEDKLTAELYVFSGVQKISVYTLAGEYLRQITLPGMASFGVRLTDGTIVTNLQPATPDPLLVMIRGDSIARVGP